MRNLTMMTDLYQITMMYGYFKKNAHEKLAVYDLFFRKGAGESEYSIMAGLDQVIDYINNLHFTQEDVDAELGRIAENYKMELDNVKELYSEDAIENLKKEMSIQKAISLIADAAVETEE